MMRATRKMMFVALVAIVSMTGSYGATVGVYGSAGYGPGAWGAYPYPGRYPPMGGGVFVGVCCDDEEQQEQDQPESSDEASEGQDPHDPATHGEAGPRF